MPGTTTTTIVQLHGGSPDWTAIAGIVVAGVVGPALGYFAAWRSDVRRFLHERGLNARDDLVERLDAVEAALAKLEEACSAMRYEAVQDLDSPRIAPAVEAAGDAFLVARAQIARLGMRPHADSQMVAKAEEAANDMQQAIESVAQAIIFHRANRYEREIEAIEKLSPAWERGRVAIRTYEKLARATVGKLVGPESGKR